MPGDAGTFGHGEDCGDLNSQGSDLPSCKGLDFAAGGEWTAEMRLGARWRLFTWSRRDWMEVYVDESRRC